MRISSNTTSGALKTMEKTHTTKVPHHTFIECTHSWVWQLSFFHAFILICWSSKLIWSIVLITDLIETLLRNLSTLETCQLTSKPNRFYCHKNNFTSTTFQLDILQNKKRNVIKFFIEKSAKFGSGIMWQEKEYCT